MTLGQLGALFDAERRFHDPKGSTSSRGEEGTAMDLMMLGAMRFS